MKKLIIILLMLLFSIDTYSQKATTSRRIAIQRVEELFIATANGDVDKIKKLMTHDFYKIKYPYSDAAVRKILLDAPYEKRQKLIDHIKHHSRKKAYLNRAGDMITVYLSNLATGKEFTIQLIDENGNGNWLVCDYDY